MKKHYAAIVGEMWKVPYAIINDDGIDRCAWCRKPIDEINDLNSHFDKHSKKEKDA